MKMDIIDEFIGGDFDKAANKLSSRVAQDNLFYLVVQNHGLGVAGAIATAPDAVQWRDGKGMTPLMKAAETGARDAAAALLQAPAIEIDAVNENGSTALMYAAHAGKASIADLLLKAGAHVNHANARGHTALMSAAAYGHKNTVGVLLAAGADPRLKSEDGATAMEFARDNGFAEIAVALAQRAKELDARDAAAKQAAPEPDREEQYRKTGSAMKDLHSRMAKAGLFA